MELDEFIVEGARLTVRGASADYLDELLARYAFLQREAGYDPEEYLEPGLSRDEIVDEWSSRGVTVPEDAIRLWQWHNGYKAGRYPGTALDSLEKSLRRYDTEPMSSLPGELLWKPDWISVAMESTYAMSTSTDVPLIRYSQDVRWEDDPAVGAKVASFCTIVGMGIYGREHNLYSVSAEGIPRTNGTDWPSLLRETGLILF